jgi:hypothetical protein
MIDDLSRLVVKLQKEFVPQWPSDNDSVNHNRSKGQCGTNS